MCGITTLLKRALSSRPLNESRAPEATKRIVGLSDSLGPVLGRSEVTDMVPALSAYNSVGLVRNS
jgi:hypothetical protein